MVSYRIVHRIVSYRIVSYRVSYRIVPYRIVSCRIALYCAVLYCIVLHCIVLYTVANRLDNCSSLYCGLPQVRLQPLNGVLRAAARMIGGVPRFGHISDYMRDILHWLPVQQRIFYRISSIVWHCVLGNAPYLLELFTLTSACSGRRSLRSASKGDFAVPRARTATRQKRAFSIVGPSVWNDLPSELRSPPRDLSSSFYKLLKTLLFGRAWAGSASE